MLTQDYYRELLQQFPPRTIKSDEELEIMQERVNSLLDKSELMADEQDYLDLLGTLIYQYEQTQNLIPDIYGVELLRVLIEERGLKQKDLVPVFNTESIVSDVLNGKRELNKKHIQKLANFFNLSPAVFFPRFN
ncbi:helix-turn-helix domain-containing protein [Crocosphaera sp. XPORK-15E]|uniref:helix-turn-helix domain-containing protein n=1 Tax=Crocosphaera sp. XPORK-15E TaxID=3110247 RepID=UPI002B20AF11|nr:helix-turn-helix domain-containing protein [Crocosphaera sp. XPORK-15E]MEA5532517.1 helix-turn-helix domain-containing protein [Crocosphaera sp. XPORK-15E]